MFPCYITYERYECFYCIYWSFFSRIRKSRGHFMKKALTSIHPNFITSISTRSFLHLFWTICVQNALPYKIFYYINLLYNLLFNVVLPFMSHHKSIPCTGTQRIDVNTSSRSCRSHHEPPVRRSLTLSRIL